MELRQTQDGGFMWTIWGVHRHPRRKRPCQRSAVHGLRHHPAEQLAEAELQSMNLQLNSVWPNVPPNSRPVKRRYVQVKSATALITTMSEGKYRPPGPRRRDPHMQRGCRPDPGPEHGSASGRTSVDPRWRAIREDGSPFAARHIRPWSR
ncbi:MAG: hypothetical protein R2856_07850 [Caldilineaceae bacterium]